MVAYFEVQKNSQRDVANPGSLWIEKRILSVDGVTDIFHATEILKRIRAVHADCARLLSLENYALHYTATEVMNEKNLLGGPRRYSTGDHTVTIPEGE
jgi:hypothetical protein